MNHIERDSASGCLVQTVLKNLPAFDGAPSVTAEVLRIKCPAGVVELIAWPHLFSVGRSPSDAYVVQEYNWYWAMQSNHSQDWQPIASMTRSPFDSSGPNAKNYIARLLPWLGISKTTEDVKWAMSATRFMLAW